MSGLSLSYDLSEDKACAEKHWVFKDLSFRIKPGEFILMAGHTGCGKSSLMNVINGVIPPNLKKKLTLRVKYMFKENELLATLSVSEQDYLAACFRMRGSK